MVHIRFVIRHSLSQPWEAKGDKVKTCIILERFTSKYSISVLCVSYSSPLSGLPLYGHWVEQPFQCPLAWKGFQSSSDRRFSDLSSLAILSSSLYPRLLSLVLQGSCRDTPD